MTLPTYAGWPFIEAAHHGGPRVHRPQVITIHTTESKEHGTTDDTAIANYFHGQPANTANPTSAHAVIDVDSCTYCVREEDVAYAAGDHANRYGIHLEHIGYASQTVADWLDAYSRGELAVSEHVAAAAARKWGITPVHLSVDQLRGIANGSPITGFCGHRDWTAAFPSDTSHTDPGTAFPWAPYLAGVSALLRPPVVPNPGATPPEDTDMSSFMYQHSGGFVVLVAEGKQVELDTATANGFNARTGQTTSAGVPYGHLNGPNPTYLSDTAVTPAQEAAWATAYGPVVRLP